jgi:hypothetical protein
MEDAMRMILLTLSATAMLAAPALAADPLKMQTAMTGAAEVPGPASPTGAGTAGVMIDPDKGQVCFRLTVTGLDTPTMAHIHKGAVGVSGPPVVVLDAPATGMSQGCKPVAADVIAALLASPSDYYVNVHTAAFPKGAIRGQLGK